MKQMKLYTNYMEFCLIWDCAPRTKTALVFYYFWGGGVAGLSNKLKINDELAIFHNVKTAWYRNNDVRSSPVGVNVHTIEVLANCLPTSSQVEVPC